MRTCSIIVRTLNEARYLGDLLEGVRAQNLPNWNIETILVDSGSTDRTLSIAEEYGCRILHLKRSEFSFGRSLNLGCDAATGEKLVFISGHCVPADENWLARLLEPFADQAVAIVYGRQVGGEETRFSEHSLFAKYFPDNPQNSQCPYFCNNANLAIDRNRWAEHRFNEALTGLEDMCLARNLWQKQRKIVYVPTACVAHYHHESWRQVKRRYEREAIALREIMPEVHVHLVDACRYFVVGVAGDWMRATKHRKLLRKATEIFVFRFCQFYGVWRGHRTHRILSRHEKERYFYPH